MIKYPYFTAIRSPGTIRKSHGFSVLSCVRLFATPRTAARQASLPITHSRSLLKLRSIESVMPPNHLILCHPRLLLPPIFPSIRVFSNETLVPELAASSWRLGPAFGAHIKTLGKINGPAFLYFPTWSLSSCGSKHCSESCHLPFCVYLVQVLLFSNLFSFDKSLHASLYHSEHRGRKDEILKTYCIYEMCNICNHRHKMHPNILT